MATLEKDVWNNINQPNINQLIIVIDKNGRVFDFGHFGFNEHVNFKEGFKWAYMQDLVNITNNKNE